MKHTGDGNAEYTGGSVGYYKVWVSNPTTPEVEPYMAECNDIIEALEMNYAEANVFKANWRRAAARQGRQKRGYTDGLYDAEKMVFFSGRVVVQEKAATDRPDGMAAPFPGTPLDFDESRADAIGQNGNNGEHYAEDMTNPANWRAGDLVECVDSGGLRGLTGGSYYRIANVVYGPNQPHLEFSGIETWPMASRFRFHSRPSADGWIDWLGGECPCDENSYVEVEKRYGIKIQSGAGSFEWRHKRGQAESPHDIIRYRML